MHLFHDISPTHSRVIGAEGDFSFLGREGNDASFGSPEIVVKEILEPHTGDEEEIPPVLAKVFDWVPAQRAEGRRVGRIEFKRGGRL